MKQLQQHIPKLGSTIEEIKKIYVESRTQLETLPTIHIIDYRLVDFLRAKGYALPFRGISVQQQIQNWWIKLI